MHTISRLLLVLNLLLSLTLSSQTFKEIDSLKNILSHEKESIEKIELFFALGEKLTVIQDFNQEKQYLDSALYLSEKLNYQEGVPRYYHKLGIMHREQGNFMEAINNYISSIKAGMSIGDSTLVAKVSIDLAVAQSIIGESETAMQNINRAMRIAEDKRDTAILIRAFDKKGFVIRNTGNFEAAIGQYENAIQLAEISGNEYEANNSTLNLGIIYKIQHNNTKALELFLKGYPYFESHGKPDIMISLDNCIGGIYFSQNQNQEALRHIHSAIEYSESLRLKPETALNLNLLSEVNLALKNYTEAEQEAEQSLQIYKEIQDQYGISSALINLGKVHQTQGNLNKAKMNYEEALKISTDVGANEKISESLFGLGTILFIQARNSYFDDKQLKYEKASNYFKSSLKLSREMGQQELIMKTYKILYQIDSATGNYQAAFDSYKSFEHYKDSILSKETSLQLAHNEYNFLREQKNKEIALITRESEIKSLQLSKQKIQRDGLLIITGFILLLGVLVIRSIYLRKRLEQQKAVSLERERISADLHDDIGSGLSKIILMSEALKNEIPEVKDKLKKISAESVELSKNISEVIWALNSRNDFLENLVAYIREFSGSYFENSSICFKMLSSRHFPVIRLSSEQRRNIFLVVKEALHNIAKHSQATESELSVVLQDKNISIVIKDNGKGLEEGKISQFGNGLILMKKRMQSIGGEFTIENKQGTTITFSVPI